MVTSYNAGELDGLLAKRGRLNISRTKPKKFTFGSIISDPKLISEEREYTFLVYKVNVGQSYVHPALRDE